MVRSFKKGDEVILTTHFASTDFDCHCSRPECTVTLISEDLPASLELLWGLAGPFKIDSGYRCPAHNKEIGGVSDSQHSEGNASDCKSLIGKTGEEMAAYAERVPRFSSGGIGTYSTFAHCDVRPWHARWKGVPC